MEERKPVADRKVGADDPRRIEYGSRLRDARIARGLTQEAAAALLGVSRSYLANLESGYRVESWPTWLAMVSTLDYDPAIVAPELCTSTKPSVQTQETESDPNTSMSTQPVDVSRPQTQQDPSKTMDS